jgi:menaquinone-dependent protoporphyrinogen oxidase
MTQVLVAYASTHGHTAKIAVRIARALRLAGAEPRTFDLSAGADPAPAGYDLVIAGGSIHAGHHQPELVDWARRHAATLDLVPSALFSVSLAAAEDTDESRTETRRYRDELLEETGWTPRRSISLAGALQYREYDFSTRLVMRLLMAAGHHPTDVHQDFEYTDWDAVDAFARECLRLADRLAAP